MQFSLTLFGPMELSHAGTPVAFAITSARALVAYLALQAGRPVPRDALATLLWPEHPQTAAYINLRQTLSRVHQALHEANGAPTLLEVTRRNVRLDDATLTIDVARFEALLAAASDHPHDNLLSCPACIERLQQAVALYRGELLQGLALPQSEAFEEWLLLRREQLHRHALDALHSLCAAAEAEGDYARMQQYAARQLALEPWHEAAHVQSMRALAARGQRAAALAQYDTCCQVLHAEFAIEPEAETRALYERIRAGELSPVRLAGPAPRHNLPASLTPFVGRERELSELAELLQQPDVRLLTLVGAGGMGKTRLALEAARAQLHRFRDGVWWVALAPVTAADALIPTISAALGLDVQGDPRMALLHSLSDKQQLLILDNFEHLLDGVDIVVDLLQAAPEVQVVATSRERLDVRGEHVVAVQALEFVSDAAAPGAAHAAAVRLFVQSARRIQPSLQVDQATLPAVLRICALVQGMPLGLELAAAWVGMLSLDDIAAEIGHSADFLATAWRDVPERQRSVRAVFDWSWRLLTDAERQAFRRLSLFRGGFTRDAAHAVADVSLRVLTRLVHTSFVQLVDAPGAAGRYAVHELLRQFAAAELDAAPDERAAVQARHSEYYLGYVARRTHQLARTEPRQAIAELHVEIDNIRQAWSWAAEHAQLDALEHSWHALWQFFWLTGPTSIGEHAFGLAAEHLRAHGEQPRVALPELCDVQRVESKMRAAQAYFLRQQGNYEQALANSQRAILLARASGSAADEAHGQLRYAQAVCRIGHYTEAQPHIRRAMELVDAIQPGEGDREDVHDLVWMTQLWLGNVAKMLGEFATARAHMNDSLRSCQGLGKLVGEMMVLLNLAELEREAEHSADARVYSEQTLAIARSVGIRWIEAIASLQLGDLLRVQGEYGSACGVLGDAVLILREVGDGHNEAVARAWLGRIHTCMGNYATARAWLDQSVELSRVAAVAVAEVAGLLLLASHLLQTGDFTAALAQATHGYQLAHAQGDRASEAHGLVLLGHANTALDRPADAAQAYEQALTLCSRLELARIAAEARAGLARLALMGGDRVPALVHVEAIWPLLGGERYVGLDEPFLVYLVCYDVLHATGDSRAATVLEAACKLLQRYADHITDSSLRRSFLEQVAVHRALRCVADDTAASSATLLAWTVRPVCSCAGAK